MDPAVLSAKIRATLAPCRLGDWPTPLEPAPALARALGIAALHLKREDRSAPCGGGNKVRGLEFLMSGAPGGTTFVTVGGRSEERRVGKECGAWCAEDGVG